MKRGMLGETMTIQELFSAGRFEEILDLTGRLVADSPDSYELHAVRAAVFMEIKKYGEAMTHLDRLLEIKPDDLGATESMGMCLEHLGKYDDALYFYAKALPHRCNHVTIKRLV